MKILILSSEDLGSFHAGGVHTTQVARAFSQLGHEVLVVAPGELDQADFRHLQCSMRFGPLASTWRTWPKIDHLKAFQPDLIYERQLIGGGFGAYLGKQWQVPVVFEVNSPHRQEMLYRFAWLRPFDFVLKSWECFQFSRAQLVVTTHEKLVPEFYSGSSLVGPWAVSVDKPQETGALWPHLDDKKIILVSGSFHSWHGLNQVQSILRHLGEGPWAVVLLGGGANRQQLAHSLKSLPFPVHDGGVLSYVQMPRAYCCAHVLLAPFDLPLPHWPFYYSPFKILEALSCGLPVLTSDYENIRQLLDDPWCGSVVQDTDPQKWAQALKDLLKKDKVDFQKGHDYMERHSWKQHALKILETLGEA